MRILILTIWIFLSCNATEREDKKENKESSIPTHSIEYCWVNSSYLECMDNELPCKCLEELGIGFILLHYRENEGTIYIYDQDGEANYLVLQSEDSNRYAVLAAQNTAPLCKINIINDTLYLIEENREYKYVKKELVYKIDRN